MIGFYDYTVVVTYISLISSIIGIFMAIEGRMQLAVFCLAFSGLCDMFDGKIARTKKNRTEDEKSFGIQIELGMCHVYSILILAFYGVAGVIRLAYFNVMETRRQAETSENRKYYQGLPITSMSVIMPLLFIVSLFFPGYRWLLVSLHIVMFLVGLLFIVDFRFRKPTNKELIVLVSVVAAAVLVVLFYRGGAWWKYHELSKLKVLKGNV